MKILHVIDSLAVGGKERMCINLATLFFKYHHAVGILVIQNPHDLKGEIPKGIQIYYLLRKRKLSLKMMQRVKNIMIEYNIIHVHSWHDRIYLWVVNLFYPFDRKIVLHDHQSKAPDSWITKILLRVILRKDWYVSASHDQYQWAKEQLRLNEMRMSVIRNFIMESNVGSSGIPKTKDLKLITVSNIFPLKNLHFLLEVVSLLKIKYKLQYTIVGKVADLHYFRNLKKLIQSFNMEKEVLFLHDVKNVQPILKDYTLALHASKRESGPLVLIEYLASQLNFLSTIAGGVSDQIKNTLPDNFIVDYYKQEWAERCIYLIDHPASNFRNVFSKHFDIGKKYHEWNEVYKNSLAQ